MKRKQQLIVDIQNLLNTYKDTNQTFINYSLLEFMDEKTLIDIIDNLLSQKENEKNVDTEWLIKFKRINE